MRALVVYESMFGNTRAVAERVADGLRSHVADVTVRSVAETADLVDHIDLLVVGGPTHVHGMSSLASRHAAEEQAENDESLHLEPDSVDCGLRQWCDELPAVDGRVAVAFDTRAAASTVVTGRASKGIVRRLRHRGYHFVVEPQSFLVDRANRLLDGEADRAEEWGRHLAQALAPVS